MAAGVVVFRPWIQGVSYNSVGVVIQDVLV